MKSNANAGNGSLRVPSIRTKAGIPLSNANCICALCESLGANESVKMPSDNNEPPKLATCKGNNEYDIKKVQTKL